MGSEMCIRDSFNYLPRFSHKRYLGFIFYGKPLHYGSNKAAIRASTSSGVPSPSTVRSSPFWL